MKQKIYLFFGVLLLPFFYALAALPPIPRTVCSEDARTILRNDWFTPKAMRENFKIKLDEVMPTFFKSEHRVYRDEFQFEKDQRGTWMLSYGETNYVRVSDSAKRYKVLFTHNNDPAELNLIISDELEGHLQGHQNFYVLAIMEFLLMHSPSVALQEVNSIILQPASNAWFRKKPIAFLGHSKSIIIPSLFFENLSQDDEFRLFKSELSYIMATKHYGSPYPYEHWLEAMKADGKEVSAYSEIGKQDFDEAVQSYLKSEAGIINPQERQTYSHRYKILDTIFKIDTTEVLGRIANDN